MARIRSVKPESSAALQVRERHLVSEHLVGLSPKFECLQEDLNFSALRVGQRRSGQQLGDSCHSLDTSQLPRPRPSTSPGAERTSVALLDRLQHREITLVHPDPKPWPDVVSGPSLTRDVDAALADEQADELAVERVHSLQRIGGED